MTTYIITGATGYIGSALIKFILKDGRIDGENQAPHIIAPVRDWHKASRMLPARVELVQTNLCDRRCVEQMLEVGSEADYIIHCASVTKSAEMISHPVEVIESIVNTTQNVLELARRCNVKSMVSLSSMEVYGNIDCSDGHRVSEQELGDLDIYNVRSCYPLGKRMAENICYSYFKEYGIPVKVARLAQTFGEGGSLSDRRVFAQFADSVRVGTDIVLHTEGSSMGNYCGIHDAVEGILTILNCGRNGQAYNVVNEENTMTIREMAELVSEKVAGGKIKVRFDIPKENIYGYAADTGLRLSGEKLKELGWTPTERLEQMYRELLEYWRQQLTRKG